MFNDVDLVFRLEVSFLIGLGKVMSAFRFAGLKFQS